MEPEQLFNCEMCEYRKTIIDHLGHARRSLSEATFDALVAYGPEKDPFD